MLMAGAAGDVVGCGIDFSIGRNSGTDRANGQAAEEARRGVGRHQGVFLERARAKAAAAVPKEFFISPSSYDSISACTIRIPEIDSSDSHFRVMAELAGRNRKVQTAVMIDSGATALFIGR